MDLLWDAVAYTTTRLVPCSIQFAYCPVASAVACTLGQSECSGGESLCGVGSISLALDRLSIIYIHLLGADCVGSVMWIAILGILPQWAAFASRAESTHK